MKLMGKNVKIRDLKMTDIEAYFHYGSDPLVGPSAGWKPFPNRTIASQVLNGQMVSHETFAIALKDSDTLIGTISLYHTAIRKYNKARSLGFSIGSSYWGKGLMKEAVDLMVCYVFTKTDCEVLEVGHHIDNLRCKRVVEKCGFQYDGTLCRFKKLFDGRLVDACFYSMTKEEFERKMKDE